MFRSIRFWGIFLISLLISSHFSFAQCNARIVPSTDVTKAYRERGSGSGKRCEGFYISKVSADALRLASVTWGEFRFVPNAKEIIEVKPFGGTGQVQFCAEGIPGNLFYRLDCQFAASAGFSWPVKDVLLKEDLTKDASKIGLLASTNGYYLPVHAKGKSAIADANPQPLVKVVCSTRVSKVMWRVAGQQNFTTLPGTSFPAERSIVIRLPQSLKGKLKIEIRAKAEDNTDWMNLDVPLQL